jgi:hypothetical protein
MDRVSAQGDPPVPLEASEAARAMVARFVDSWNRADGAAYGENYWPDAELVDPSGVISRGQAIIVQEHIEKPSCRADPARADAGSHIYDGGLRH